MESKLIEKVMETVTPNVLYRKTDVISAIKEAGESKCVGILYARSGDRFLGIGQRSYCRETNAMSFNVDKIIGREGKYGELKGYNALSITSRFFGVKLTVSHGRSVNEIYNSPNLFANDAALLSAIEYIR